MDHGRMLAGMFVLGGVTGAGVMRVLSDRAMSALLAGPPAEAGQRLRVQALARQLGLSKPQKRQIAALLRRRTSSAPGDRAPAGADDAMPRKGLPEISELLTPTQREKLDRILRARGRPGLPPAPR